MSASPAKVVRGVPEPGGEHDDRRGRACPFCAASGRCQKCYGSGVRAARRGRFKWKQVVECRACEGTGACPLCRGSGRLPA